MAKAEHERRLAELERAQRRSEGVEVSEETALDIVAGSALVVGEGTPRPELAYPAWVAGGMEALAAVDARGGAEVGRAVDAYARGGMEALAAVDARVAAEVGRAVDAYARGGMEALAALDARVADDVLLRIGTLA